MSLGGNIVPVENLAESLQVAFDAGAKRLLLPMASVKDIPTIPGELFAKFQTGFYADPVGCRVQGVGGGVAEMEPPRRKSKWDGDSDGPRGYPGRKLAAWGIFGLDTSVGKVFVDPLEITAVIEAAPGLVSGRGSRSFHHRPCPVRRVSRSAPSWSPASIAASFARSAGESFASTAASSASPEAESCPKPSLPCPASSDVPAFAFSASPVQTQVQAVGGVDVSLDSTMSCDAASARLHRGCRGFKSPIAHSRRAVVPD